MNAQVMQVVSRIPHECLAVYLFLVDRAKMDTKLGLTQQELSRHTRLSVGAVREALGWLEHPTYVDANLKTTERIPPFIRIEKFSKAHKIVLIHPYANEEFIRFTFDDTDDRRIKVLEDELRRLSERLTNKGRTSVYIRGVKGDVVSEIESDLGRDLTKEEAILVGGIMDSFVDGPNRLKMAWRRHAPNSDKPIVALYAMFQKNRFGNKAPQIEPEKEAAHYRPIIRDTDPV